MLIELRVNQLALVDELVLPISPGLTMITGETGAGKSMIAGALSLLGGGKVPKDLVRQGEDLAWVEGVFDLADAPATRDRLARSGILAGSDGIIVLRREIRREGRNRVLINGLVSSLSLLEQVGPDLLSIQSQDQQRELDDRSFIRDFLDSAAGCSESRAQVEAAYESWRLAERSLAQRRIETEASLEQLDLWRYQRDELAAAGLDAAEESGLAEALGLKRHANALREAAESAAVSLDEGDASARAALGRALSALGPLADVSPLLKAIVELLTEAEAATGEASRDLSRFQDRLDLDPAGLEALEQRQSLYQELRRKYNRETRSLLSYLADLERKIGRHRDSEQDLTELEAAANAAARDLEKAATELRAKRLRAAVEVSDAAAAVIRPLSLPDLDLEFSIEPRTDPESQLVVDGEPCRIGIDGADIVRLMVRTNPGERMGEVGDIASGGERSRIHLGLAALRRDRPEPPLMLCDEIDAGLGMDAARPVAALLNRLAQSGQIVCISHLPTMAVAGREHLLVGKEVDAGRTLLRVRRLAGEERVMELARLLGGSPGEHDQGTDDISRTAYARALLAEDAVPH